MIKSIKLFLFITINLFCFYTNATGDVKTACRGAKLGVLELRERDRISNVGIIKSQKFGGSKFALALRDFYSRKVIPENESDLIQFAGEVNKSHIPESNLKRSSLKYFSQKSKVEDPKGYRQELIDRFNEVVPDRFNKMQWLLNLKDPVLLPPTIGPAFRDEIQNFYGAKARLSRALNGKFSLEVVFSNHASESLPSLIPLIAHELHHASMYKTRIALLEDEELYTEFLLIDEAVANDLQMQVYVELAKKYPEIFCDWIYVSWRFGEIPIPLSWAMASFEKEMRSGKTILWYATNGGFKNHKNLLNGSGAALRKDIQEKITSLRLRYVK